jgi:hypothetical protein
MRVQCVHATTRAANRRARWAWAQAMATIMAHVLIMCVQQPCNEAMSKHSKDAADISSV